ncbi:hypothetical protein FQN54_000833 [Arachnomyces sp. PD_36]|nr:hypothetical protein FQN54_000833 [Arachnomyces sp. PD_36]
MLWCSAQTADFVSLRLPGTRFKATCALYDLSTSLMAERDPDNWRRTYSDFQLEHVSSQTPRPYSSAPHDTTATNEPSGTLDDVLTFTLLAVAVSGGEFKSDCLKWWSKALRLAFTLGLNKEDEPSSPRTSQANPVLGSGGWPEPDSLQEIEAKEERRRVFWLLYCLDRHLSLSHNRALRIPDSACEIFVPLPETIWENLDKIGPEGLPNRIYGPLTIVTGTGFFEYFLPLMAILGDIIDVHRRRDHPRLGGLDESQTVAVIAGVLADCERSVAELAKQNEMGIYDILNKPVQNPNDPIQAASPHPGAAPEDPEKRQSGRNNTRRLVVAYSTHIIHVLYVLLYGKWDAIAMLDNEDDWITSSQFGECASHAITASQAVSSILSLDPELVFAPYLFGIYLLHGSFILLLFADRMPQLGPNPSVEQACETLIRAHEVCVVTLSTEFQVCDKT